MAESAHQVPLLQRGDVDGVSPQRGALASVSPASQDVTQVARQRTQAEEAALDVAFGSVSGMIGKIIEYPFDTVKVRLQSDARYSGPLDCFSQSLRSEGIGGLYRGISAPMLGAAVETSSLFFSYRLGQEALEKTIYRGKSEDESLPLTALVFCGAASGAFTSMLLTPIELVKCQLQVPIEAQPGVTHGAAVQRSPLAVIATLYRHGGVAGFWRGQMGTLIRETGGSAAWFGSFEFVKAIFRRRATATQSAQKPSPQPLAIWQQMTAGACAGMAYNFAFYPADTIKSRMQTEQVGTSSSSAPKTSFLDVGRALWREQGLRGMYRGCGITVARAAPSSAFIFTIYESLRLWFG